MKNLINRILPLFFAILSISDVNAQMWNVPDDYEFNSEEDYKKYRDQAVGAIRWVLENRASKSIEWQSAGRFGFQWISGTDEISVSMLPNVITFSGDKDFEYSSEMLVVYLFGLARYQIDNNQKESSAEAQLAAVNAMVDAYEKIDGISKSKALTKLLKMKGKDKLDKWVRQQVNQ